MGLFDKIFGNAKQPTKEPQGFFKTFTAYQPVFTSRAGGVYESELVRAAIHARATHISKLDVKCYGAAKPKLQTKLKLAPNSWQTWGQFLYRASTILDAQNNLFIVPVFDEYGETSGIYALLPSKCEIVQYGGEPWLRYQFADGKCASVEMSRCGIMTKFQYKHDFFGENNNALAPTMDLVNIQNQGIAEGVKSAASYRFVAKMKNFVKPEDMVKEREQFTENNLSKGSGLLLFPNNYEDIKQIEAKPFVISAEQMSAISTNVFNYFGVNEDVLQNRAFGDAWSAFYEGAVEPFAIQLSEVLTKMLFSENERARGSEVMATSNRLQYMSNNEKLAVSAQMADRGLMSRNEIRQIWNLPPLPDDIGETLPVRGEYYDINKEDEADAGET